MVINTSLQGTHYNNTVVSLVWETNSLAFDTIQHLGRERRVYCYSCELASNTDIDNAGKVHSESAVNHCGLFIISIKE